MNTLKFGVGRLGLKEYFAHKAHHTHIYEDLYVDPHDVELFQEG